jgi:hypothetical protein
MNALALFVASFVICFALGFQQFNLQRSLVVSAIVTSAVISLASLVQFRLLPFTPTALEIAAYLVGSALGIVGAMKAHPAFMAWRTNRWQPADEDHPWRGVIEELGTSDFLKLHQDDTSAERDRLQAELARAVAVSDIESFCQRRSFSSGWYYDTADLREADPFEQAAVPRAVRYLELLGELARHPTHSALVRIKS